MSNRINRLPNVVRWAAARPGLAIALGLIPLVMPGWLDRAAGDDAARRVLADAFHPPREYAGDFGPYRSPLTFDDGRPVRDRRPTGASAGRRSSRPGTGSWGPWPPADRAAEGRGAGVDAAGGLHAAPGAGRGRPRPDDRTATCSSPDGHGPFPAVLVVFYEPETAIGRGKPRLDFAYQLARRGFVALSIGFDPRRDRPGQERL